MPLPKSPQSLTGSSGKAADESFVLPGTNVTLDSPDATRPKADGVAFPFKLGRSLAEGAHASTVTLQSEFVATPMEGGQEKTLGVAAGQVDGADSAARPAAVRTETAPKERPQVERFATAQET